MRLFRPKSFLQLVIIGFALVALPMIFLVYTLKNAVDRLAARSQQAVYRAVQVTRQSRKLAEQLIAMERHARQFQVLGDHTLLEAYAETHRTFHNTLKTLAALPLNAFQQRQLQVVAEKENAVFAIVLGHPRESPQSQEAVREFVPLTELTRSIVSKSDELVEREVDAMQATAAGTQRMVVGLSLALILSSVAFVVIFTTLISRPIRQIDQAIRRIGDGDFTTESTVRGPRDLEYLGRRLNWLRSRLLELEAEKRKFLRHVSHELKTPLTAIREGTALLAEEVPGPLGAQQHEVVEILQYNSLHLQKLIEDLLHFSTTPTLNVSLARHEVRLDELIATVAMDHKLPMMAKDITLTVTASDVVVLGDEEKLRIIIGNLLSNAVKYTPPCGQINVLLSQDAHGAILAVTDSGPGIAREEEDKIFDAFYQGKIVPQGHVKGSGLGLAIIKDYVLAHRGSIAVVQDGKSGAHFRITIPFV